MPTMASEVETDYSSRPASPRVLSEKSDTNSLISLKLEISSYEANRSSPPVTNHHVKERFIQPDVDSIADTHRSQEERISMADESVIGPSDECDPVDDEQLSTGVEEKHFEDEQNAIDEIHETTTYIDVPTTTVETETVQSVITHPKRLKFLSKLPFFRKSKKPAESKTHHLKINQIFRYADKWDILLMILGTITAVITGSCFPVMLFIYQSVANNLVDLGKINANVSDSDKLNVSPGECYVVPNVTANIESPQQAIIRLVNYYVILGFINMICSWVAWSSWMLAAERQVKRIRFLLFRNILHQEIGWFDVHNAGELSNRLIDDLDKIKNGINEQVPDFINLLTRMLGALIYALAVGWKLSLVFLSVSPLIVIAFNLITVVMLRYASKENKAFAMASAVAQEVLQNIRTVTAFHGQVKEQERFAKNLLVAKRIAIRKGLLMGTCQFFVQVFTFLAFTVSFWYGPRLVRTECATYTPGSMLVIFIACFSATVSAAQFIPNFQNFAEALASGSYVFDMIARITQIDASGDEGDKPKTIIGNIKFNNVTFTFPARKDTPILNNISFDIPFGKTVALVGPSGCGKSTTIQLIQRFYDPEEGQILLDGKDIKTLNVAWLRSHIGIVSQEPVLFTGTIEENIRFGKQDATDQEVQAAAKMANAHDFIMELPDNYKTSSGDKLSGGQKQRVAIARALISNPKILLLDEATSALDNESERIVQDALDKAKLGRTTIVIAHRLSTIRNADLIIALDKGDVVEQGTHEELIQCKALYYELVTAQTQQEKEKEVASDSDGGDDDIEREFVREKSRSSEYSKQSSTNEDDSNPSVSEEEMKTSEVTQKEKNPFFLRAFKLNAPEWPWLTMGAIASLIFGSIQPLFALFFAKTYGLFTEPDLKTQEHLASIYSGICFAIGFVGGVAQFCSTVGFAKSGEELTVRMRKLTFAAMLRQEIGYFDNQMNSVGALVTRLSTDSAALKGMTGVRIGIFFEALSATVTALAIAFSSGWKLTLVILSFIPLMMFAGKVQGQKQGKAAQSKGKRSFSELGGQHATQAIEHIRTVVALHQENHFIRLYEDAFDQEFKIDRCYIPLIAFGAALANSTFYFLHCTTFAYGSKLVQNKEMEYSNVFKVFAVITFAMITVGRSMAMIPGYSKAQSAAVRILKLHNRQSKINPHDESGIVLKEVVGKVEFQDVHFRYPSRPTARIFRGFSLNCYANSTTALVGPSGGGKSTTISLLQRFYDPLKGKILLDGHDIKILNIRWLRSIMGLVQQEPVLFNMSIRDNIAYGENSREVTQIEIEEAAEKANIHQTITALPQGYDTPCGAKGHQLSGGQKQRIAIARALIRSPKLLLLDEATSALDNKSESIVEAALDAARSNRTCITIAHRLSTIQNSEQIAVVDRGKLKEQGTHDELLTMNGIYAKLSLIQQRTT